MDFKSSGKIYCPKRYRLIIFLILQIITVCILSLFPEFIEKFYSNGFYKILSEFSRKLFANIGFSIGDVLYGLVIAFLIFRIIKNRKQLNFKFFVIGTLNAVSVFYFLFNLLWGLNYYRIPLSEKMNLSYEYSCKQLFDYTAKLIEKSNALHLEITQNDSVKVVNPYSNKQIFQKSENGYNNLALNYPEFTYKNPCVKNSLLSLPLSYMGFGGYLNPFTGEAQANALLPKYTFPTTTLHEIAHQIGYASESEANFIGYLASISSDDIYFRYSGYIYALRYCLRNIEKTNPEKVEELLSEINYGILLNFEESKQFWESHQTPIEKFFKVFYDNFLKINSQKEGMETYSRFVGLLISYEQ
ncbi:MAG: DUF3810 domain-containing protein [Flavobacteriaceae bacterium]